MMSIDLIIPWVDGSDPQWQKAKAKIDANGDQRAIRYRDWGLMRYWFRGVEQCLPWIRHIHFVTFGHLPPWLNLQHPKLRIVYHRDYIPSQYLPCFSSHPIELNFHRIRGLAEQFIYANDDCFFLRPCAPDFFFQNGLPRDAAIQNVLQFHRADGIDRIIANNLECINLHFDKKMLLHRQPQKWLALCYGKKLAHNLYLMPFRHFTGFEDFHLPCGYLKNTFETVWKKCPQPLERSCLHPIRSNEDVNQWLFRYWQLAEGSFIPCKPKRGAFFAIGRDDEDIKKMLATPSLPMICLSDDEEDLDFEKERAFLRAAFQRLFPQPSSFETSEAKDGQ